VKLLEADVIFAIHENQIQQYGGDSSHYIYSRERVESINFSTVSAFWV
jgi:hypothetical protein